MKNKINAWLNSNSSNESKVLEIEAVAEQFAIDFYEWCRWNIYDKGSCIMVDKTERIISNKEALELYKRSLSTDSNRHIR